MFEEFVKGWLMGIGIYRTIIFLSQIAKKGIFGYWEDLMKDDKYLYENDLKAAVAREAEKHGLKEPFNIEYRPEHAAYLVKECTPESKYPVEIRLNKYY